MLNHSRLRNLLAAPVAAFAAVGAMTVVVPAQATSAVSSSAASLSAPVRSPLVHKDRIHDVRASWFSNPDALKRVRRHKRADIKKIRVGYGRKLVANIRTRKAMPKNHLGLVVRISTDPDGYDYAVSFVRGMYNGRNELVLETSHYRSVSCAGLDVRRKRAKQRMKVIVPARCIKRPRTVKVGFATLIEGKKKMYIDDAFSRTTDGRDLKMSRWIRRR